MPSHPKLRPIDASAFAQNGQPAILLRDPLQLSGNYMVVPQYLGPALGLLDGTRELAGVQALVKAQFRLPLPMDLLEHLVAVLDENLMLDNPRSQEATQRVLAAYREAPFRPPMMAGQSYPADPGDLRRLFDRYLARVPNDRPAAPGGRGVISPHIDYPRGGPVYAAVWQEAAEVAREADLVILLGTDHYGNGDRLTLTRQHYATPYGVLPTDQAIVDDLAQAIGPEAAFHGELRNRGEHSLELVATWLHHMRDGRPVGMVPVLTGSLGDFVLGGGEPAADPLLRAFASTLRQHMAGRQVLVVASGDLAHVGPAFGGQPLDDKGKALIGDADQELMARLAAGDATGFFGAIRQVRDRNNVCGVAPFYLMLQVLGEVEGQVTAYDQCAADPDQTSVVSICGMVFG